MMVNSSLYYIMDGTGNYYRINENKELDALLKPEGISYSVIAKYRNTISNEIHTCMVPGNMRIHSFGIMASEVRICIRVSMQL